ncbi:serine/threonine-protein phosphatase 2A 65 kDa regulatory subunit A beta (macronuclear) [Tetrahymena thermophila SB210]|uniref:Serine/threonine-protein phosphatase 2A 65 kDa regulatory subunit A beta n=1 Tax=Tetrahymena thermophila (strain SB210) TaxID=312017 RepID=I7MH70_TETTS|nr:serine/threonine-protein phosphatase 2A 65 kDa regulatory subunit A beta [Tetrahymena thermophila SB210]EAR87276.1 serine/threonine-protein phosphatase 2A 65 kDa regulatory subunit A beta [Tetrahymena thermophila SB210]|eukprot:XP_001007521.1 serine/threonine-protein phosphatase 2A 65 kDa regulatory subunit A beta [Tetrahymena thermophila SB210]
MNLEDNDEDCTIYIEELKSDDPNLKINAVSKITSIAEILGPRRVREELIPYIIEIIEELDNEDEFLIKLAEQILLLNDFIDGKEHSHLLISPLELLSSMEENSVREKAVKCLIQIAQDQSPKFFTNNFLPMVRQLAQWDNYSSRISACSLLGACYSQFNQTEKKEILQFFQELCRDDTPMVRRTAAENLGYIADCQKGDFIYSVLVPLWQDLVQDQTDSVKVKAIEVSIKLMDKLNKQEVSDQFVKPLKDVLNLKNKSWRIRYAVAEVLGDLVNHLEKEVSRKEMVTIYETLLKDSEHEVRSVALIKLKDICKCLTEGVLVNNILPILNGLVQDTSQHVRTSLGEVLCSISVNFEVKNVISGILPIIENLLKDDMLDVRLNVMNNIEPLNNHIGNDNVKKSVLPLFEQISTEKQWRFRLAFVEFLPKLTQQLGFAEFKDNLIEYMKQFFFDHYSEIRQQNFKNFITLSKQHGYQNIKPIIVEGINNLAKSSNYIFRVSSLQGIQIISEILPKSDLQSLFEDMSSKLMSDPVPNVKINLLKLYISIQDKLDPSVRVSFSSNAKRSLAQDTDSDVQYYITQI